MNVKLTLNREFVKNRIDKRLYGSFLEHIGRAIYHGVYEPEHPTADDMGFRRDVMSLIRELDVPVIRYPGGNFVSGYRWEDGVGPVELRPRTLDRAWYATETNRFGTDEFAEFCRRAGSEAMLAVNLGTRGVEDAANLVEYCNYPGGSRYSDMRIANGHKEPHGIRLWCLGNEMDGKWQIGHHTAEEYGRLANEAGKLMKRTDPGIGLVLCGSSKHYDMPTFPEWDRVVLEQAYETVDYLSLHTYFNRQDGDTASFLASNADMEQHILDSTATCDYVKAKFRSKKTIWLSFDEYNIWNSTKDVFTRWSEAPHRLEAIYTLEDAVSLGGQLITLIRHSDRVKVACLAQLVNVIAPILTEDGGRVFKQAIYYPYLHASRYGRGQVLHTLTEGPSYECRRWGTVPTVDAVGVLGEDGSVTVIACNRSLDQSMTLSLRLQEFGRLIPERHILLTGDKDDCNSFEEPARVQPREVNDITEEDGQFFAELPPISWNVLRFRSAAAETAGQS